MWPLLVVLHDPAAGDLSDLLQAAKQIQIQDLIPVGPVKAFDVGVLVRLARLYVLDQHAVIATPVRQCLTDKFRTIVDTQDIGCTPLRFELVQHPDDARCP